MGRGQGDCRILEKRGLEVEDMKRNVILALIMICLLSLSACGGGKEDTQRPEGQDADKEVISVSYPENYVKRDNTGLFGNETYSRSDILTITVTDSLDGMSDEAWDVSENGDGSVMAWVEDGTNFYIGGEGGVTAKDCESLFANFANVTEIVFNDCFYTEPAVDFSYMFGENYYLTELDLSSLNTANAETMERMFMGCARLEKVNVTSFDTSKVRDMSQMFDQCRCLKEVDLTSFDTSSVENMYYMFDHCMEIESLDLSSFQTSNVTNFEGMFKACWVIQSLDLSNFDLSKATTCKDMFLCCELLTDVGCELNIPSGIDTTDMFDRSGME